MPICAKRLPLNPAEEFMLIRIPQSPTLAKRPASFGLLIACVFMLALPALQTLSAADESNDAKASDAKPMGRIFVTVFVRKDNSFENLLISVDPATGKWQKFADGD